MKAVMPPHRGVSVQHVLFPPPEKQMDVTRVVLTFKPRWREGESEGHAVMGAAILRERRLFMPLTSVNE